MMDYYQHLHLIIENILFGIMLTISLPNDAGEGLFKIRFNNITSAIPTNRRAIETIPPPRTDGTMIVASLEPVLPGKGEVVPKITL